MAHINPHHDWHDAPGHRGKSAEWESLRNELVALLDQVEDQVSNPRSKGSAMPMRAAPAPSGSLRPSRERADANRHGAALRTVRDTVEKLSERSERPLAGRADAVTDAIGKIRARQGNRPHQARPEQPDRREDPAAGLARSVSALGQRIEQFESRLSTQLGKLDRHDEISGQIAQLSEVIELLASAVGETGQVRRLETQLQDLAHTVGQNQNASQSEVIERLEALAQTIEKLTAHQIEARGHDAQREADLDRTQSEAMEAIEESLRNIYDRMDAMAAREDHGGEVIDRISRDLADLSANFETRFDPGLLLERLDALDARIERLAQTDGHADQGLRESVAVLRDVITEVIDPRFEAIEQHIAAIDMPQAAGQARSGDGVETQLRAMTARIEDIAGQLAAMAAVPETVAAGSEAPDFSALADMIVERARAGQQTDTETEDRIAKADLSALEERLARLVSHDRDAGSPDQLDGLKDGISQVDNRLARLEAMLNSPPAASSAESSHNDAPRRPRKASREDIMPEDPVSGAPSPRRHADEPPAAPQLDTSPAAFKIDPEAVERPSKPKSSLVDQDETGFAAQWQPPEADNAAAQSDAVAAADQGAVNRSSFIEAARRAARQPVAHEEEEPKSLIGRAMARFQRNEAETPSPAAPDAPHGVSAVRSEPQFTASAPQDSEPGQDEAPDAPKGFFARNKRPLLLSTALVIVIGLTAHFVLNRPAPRATLDTPPVASEQAPASQSEDTTLTEPETEMSAPEADVEIAPISSTDEVTSPVRMIDQSPNLLAGSPDALTLSNGAGVDPIETAAIPSEPDRYIERTASLPAVSQLPEISVPEAIEPQQLRLAAEGGDMRAQFEIGAILTEGHVVEQDLSQAAAWYERAAAQGFAPAQYRLGNLYEGGRGVERDLELARLWYQRAAEAGNRMSMHNLASLYAGGELESQDFDAAAHWFEQAAARGLTDSQFNLGMLYARGLGVDQDFEQSYIWFSLAARSGDADADNAREDVARSLDADSIQALNTTLADWTPAEIDMAANFAPIGTWDPDFDPGPAIANADVIKQVQMLLDKLGYNVGEPDGIAGPMTRDAVAAFEQDTGMSESGTINPRLLAVLGSQPV